MSDDAFEHGAKRFKKQLKIFLSISVGALIVFTSYNLYIVGPSYKELIVGFVERDAYSIAQNLKENGVSIDQATKSISPLPTFARVIEGYEIKKIKIFNHEGRVTFSTVSQEIGTVNSNPYFKEQVAKGRPYTKLKTKDETSLEGEIISRDIVESYIPIMNNGQFIGAFELYLDITDKLVDLTQIYHRVLAVSLFFIITIFIVVVVFYRFLKGSSVELYNLQRRVDQSGRMASIGTLASGMAHELNNPLTVIKGYLKSIEKDRENKEHVEKCLLKIGQSADRIELIVKSLQNKSRRAKEHEQKPLDVRSVLMGAVAQVTEIFKVEGIEIWLDVSTGVEQIPIVKGNLFDLEIVFQQLLNNSRDALLHDRVKKRLIEITLNSTEDLVTVLYQDSGMGMSPETISHIFDPFFSTKDVGRGSGLGMHVVQKIIREHLGTIDVSSELSKGALFNIVLPRMKN